MKALKFILAMLVGSFLWTSSVSAAEGPYPAKDKHGWVEKEGPGYMISNTGLNGGVVVVGCEKPNYDIIIRYTPKGKKLTKLFLIDIADLYTLPGHVTSTAFGLNTLTADVVLERLNYSATGFLGAYYAPNAVEQFFTYKLDPVNNRLPIPVGWEKFLGGGEVKEYIKKMRSQCTVDAKQPYL